MGVGKAEGEGEANTFATPETPKHGPVTRFHLVEVSAHIPRDDDRLGGNGLDMEMRVALGLYRVSRTWRRE